MNFGITEDFSRLYIAGMNDLDGVTLAATRVLDISDICFLRKKNDTVRLYYTEASFGRLVRIEIFTSPKMTYATFLFLDEPSDEVMSRYGGKRNYEQRLPGLAKDLGFSEPGLMAMLHKFALPRDPESLSKARKRKEVVT